ncbi:hypothetical protein Tco_0083482 [Tanacetum coccineum]
MSIPSLRPCMCASAALLECNYGVLGETYMTYPRLGRIKRPLPDFEEYAVSTSTIRRMKYFGQRRRTSWIYPIRRIHQEDTTYPCLYFTRNHEDIKTNTPYPEASIRRIQGLLYTKILEDIKRGPYSKKAGVSPIRRIPHRPIRRIEPTTRLHK